MIYGLYRFLTALGTPLVEGYLRHRLAKGKEDKERFSERFGHPSKPRPDGPLVWCHAASVGEAVSVLLLLEEVHATHSNISFLLTTGTVTAARMMEKRLPPCARHQYVPIDLAPCVDRFLDYWKPSFALWTESELWPNTLAALRQRAIPAVLLNARMSDRSFRRWSMVKGFAKELLSTFDLCLTQTEADQGRFAALGASLVKCVGNLKYVSSPLPFVPEELGRLKAVVRERPLWLAASTHSGEEDVVLATHKALKVRHPRLLTVLAPRHAVRGDDVAALIEASGFTCARRSKSEPIQEKTEIYLADTMGEMGLLYSLCPITFVGGSFSGTGGHNPIEPAWLGSAIMFGPSMYNFSEIEREFVSRQAALPVGKAEDLAPTIECLLTDEPKRNRQAKAAKDLAEQKRSILGKIMLEIEPWLK